MKTDKKGVSLIALIITIVIIIIIAGTTIQNGMQRTDEARIARHNINITTIQEELENYYNYKGGELPVVDLTPYPIPAGSSLLAETFKNSEDTDTFYKLNSYKLGKVAGKDDYTCIVSATRHNVYCIEGTTIRGITYHGLIAKNNVKLAQVPPYNKPVVPIGFSHIGTETWDNGFTIQDSSGNQFVWVPALAPVIQANGTLDNTNFNSKFGRRNFRAAKGDIFNTSNFHETADIVLQNMILSVNKYGGFYIGRYETSNSGGKGQSKANVMPWVSIDWNAAKAKAESMDTDWGWDTSAVESYLCYGTHWDTTLEWLIDSGTKTASEIIDDSTSWGNHSNDTFTGALDVGNTGQWSQTCVKGIYDLAGNAHEWTMESLASSYRVDRGGGCYQSGSVVPIAYRNGGMPSDIYEDLSWRVVLYIK